MPGRRRRSHEIPIHQQRLKPQNLERLGSVHARRQKRSVGTGSPEASVAVSRREPPFSIRISRRYHLDGLMAIGGDVPCADGKRNHKHRLAGRCWRYRGNISRGHSACFSSSFVSTRRAFKIRADGAVTPCRVERQCPALSPPLQRILARVAPARGVPIRPKRSGDG